jgi:hypothetical protein
MKAYLIWMVAGPQIILTSCDLVTHPECLKKLADAGVSKFMAQELPLDAVKERYGEHYEIVINSPNETDELRILDTDGDRVLKNISFKGLSQPIYYEPEQTAAST